MAKRFKPYGGRIVVKKITEKERGGLIVPALAQKRALIGKVFHVGPNVDDIEVGDIVLFAQYSGCTPYMDAELQAEYGEDIVVMNGEDILCFIEDEPAQVEVAAGAD